MFSDVDDSFGDFLSSAPPSTVVATSSSIPHNVEMVGTEATNSLATSIQSDNVKQKGRKELGIFLF